MKNKTIFLSLLLGSCISTAEAKIKPHVDSFYIGTKGSFVQPNNPTLIDLLNVSDSYKDFWKTSLFGFCIGYQYNPYFSIELSYNNTFKNFPAKVNFLNSDETNKNSYGLYVENVTKEKSREEQIKEMQAKRKNPLVDQLYPVERVKTPKNPLPINKDELKKNLLFKRSYDYASSFKKKFIFYPQQNLEFTAKFSIPITNKIYFYSRAGASLDINKNLYHNYKKNPQNFLAQNVSPLISAGFQFQIKKNLFTRIEFERKMHLLSKQNIQHNDLNSININFLWSFKNILPKSSKKIFSLNFFSPKVFKFNQLITFPNKSFKLTHNEKNVLNKLINSIKKNSLKKIKVFIQGHCDKSEKYNKNQMFSLLRMNAISKYLQNNGIFSKQIVIKDNTNLKSITKNLCNKQTNKKFLRLCLSPDRRVEIFIEGVK
ncbi:Outer membrane protein A [Buchnera aphidicola (Periphyllus testudinaceus)]|uniref:OmpA family protein n=1 Tax=Buchnera aphidicola TaxID=9 RepID=UPI003464192D